MEILVSLKCFDEEQDEVRRIKNKQTNKMNRDTENVLFSLMNQNLRFTC